MSYFFLYTTGLIPGGLLFLVFHPVSLLALSQSSTMVYATVGLPPTFYAPKLASLIMVSFSFFFTILLSRNIFGFFKVLFLVEYLPRLSPSCSPLIQSESGIKSRLFISFHVFSESSVLNCAVSSAVAEWRTDPWRLPPLVLKEKLKVKGFINVDLFEQLLTGFDVTKTQFILNGLRNGFPMGLKPEGPFPPSKLWVQSIVSRSDRVIVNEYLDGEVTANRMFGPFPVPRGLWKDSVTYPMSVVLKKDLTPRIISNYSHGGPTLSVNGFIPKSATKTSYPSLLAVATAMVEVGLDRVFFGVFDIKHAYRNLFIQASDWKFSIVSWQRFPNGPRVYYLDPYMGYGGGSSPCTFNLFGDGLQYILDSSCFVRDLDGFLSFLQRLIRYLDDHLLMAISAETTNLILDRMLALMIRLNIPVKGSKTIRAAPTVKFLGYLWVPRSNRITLDGQRWSEVEDRLRHLLLRLIPGEANAQDLRCLLGLLVWCSVVIPTAKIFLRGCHTVLSRLKATSLPASQARLIMITDPVLIADVAFDLEWWIELCSSFRLCGLRPTGKKISEIVVAPVLIKSDCKLVIFSDASNKGVGGYQMDPVIVAPSEIPVCLWCFSQLPEGMTMSFLEDFEPNRERRAVVNDIEVGSGYSEAAGILYVLCCFLPPWAAANPNRELGAGVWCHSDSEVVVEMWNSKRAGITLLPYLRAFAHLSALFNINLTIAHIPGSENQVADAISRKKMAKFRRLLPNAALNPTPLLYNQVIFF